MKTFVKSYFQYIETVIASKKMTPEIYEYHKTHLSWFQHERLIHLMVLCLTTVILIALFITQFFVDNVGILILTAVIGVLDLFYFFHYFFLENSVQKLRTSD